MSIENKSYSVLVIDDDEDILKIVELGLSRISELNLVTAFASDGKEGLKLCKNFKFDAVITDYFMPNMDGLQFIKEFRESSAIKNIPIIFTSGYFANLKTENEDIFEDVIFMEKPFELAKLCSFLKLYLQGAKLAKR